MKLNGVIGFCVAVIGGCAAGSNAEQQPMPSAPKESVPAVDSARVSIAKAEWAQFIHAVGSRYVPHEAYGRVEGIKFYPGPRSSSVGRMGLQSGQLVTAINAQRFANHQVTELEKVITAELERSIRECALSLTVKDADDERVLSASCME